MNDGSKGTPRITVGLDLGDKYSYLCLIDTESGEVIEEGRLRTTPEALGRRFCSQQLPLRIAIEAGTHSPWVSRVLEEECGHEVLVANPRKTRLIYSSKRKTDEIDAENLARLARLDSKLLYPLKHRGEDSQAHPSIIRSRESLVGSRTQLVNHVRGAVKSFGHRLPRCPARSFHKKAPEHIPPEALRPALEPILETIAAPSQSVSASMIVSCKPSAKRALPRNRSLASGRRARRALTALAFVLTLEDPYRFERSRSVGAYLGDLILCTEPLKECELPESADRSIAREGQNPLHSATDSSRHVGPDKMCLLIEVRYLSSVPASGTGRCQSR